MQARFHGDLPVCLDREGLQAGLFRQFGQNRSQFLECEEAILPAQGPVAEDDDGLTGIIRIGVCRCFASAGLGQLYIDQSAVIETGGHQKKNDEQEDDIEQRRQHVTPFGSGLLATQFAGLEARHQEVFSAVGEALRTGF